MTVTLYHFPGSLCSQKVRLALAEKGVPWDAEVVDILKGDNLHPDYMKLNPAGVVPTLVHNGTPVTGSRQILKYINREFTGPNLEDGNAGLIEAWLRLQDMMPIRTLTYGIPKGLRGWLMRGTVRPKRRKAAKAAGKAFSLRKEYAAKLRDLDAWEATLKDPDAVNRALAQVDGALDMVDATLKKQRWLAGDHYTLADMAWTPIFARLEMLGLADRWETGPRREISRYIAHLQRRPSFEAAITAYVEDQKVYLRQAAVRRLKPWLITLAVLLLIGAAGFFFQDQVTDLLAALN